MKRPIGIVALLAASWGIASAWQYQPGPYAPRQPYPARPYPPYGNPALTNNPYLQRPGVPVGRPFLTNAVPGGQTNRFSPAPRRANAWPAQRYLPNRPYATNLIPGNRFAPNPYSFTNVVPRAGYATNLSQFRPTDTNLTNHAAAPKNFGLTNGLNTGNNFAPPPGTTNFLLPNATNSESRLLITPALRRNIDRLTAVLHSIKTPPVSSSQQQQILSTVRTSALGTTKPSKGAVTKLVDDLVSAWPNKGFTYQQKFQLALDVNRLLNSGNLTQGEVLVVINDARRVFHAGGVGEESMTLVIDDLNAIAADVQKASAKESAAVPEAEK